MAESKTARAARKAVEGSIITKKEVISDEEYLRQLRIDLSSGIYVSQEGARALLRLYDVALARIAELEKRPGVVFVPTEPVEAPKAPAMIPGIPAPSFSMQMQDQCEPIHAVTNNTAENSVG